MARLQAKLWQQVNQPASETPTIVTKPAQQEEAKRRHKRSPISNSTTAKVTRQYSIPKRAARKGGNRTGPENGRTGVQNTRIDITEHFIDNAIPPSQQQVIYRDSKLIGFGLRHTCAGSKSFIVECRVNGINRRVTIGRADLFSVEEARNEAVRLLRQMVSGINPLTLRKKQKRELSRQ